MTSIALAKLIIDGLLLCSLIYVAFRMTAKQQPGTIANLAKLKELESSLREIVQEADDASSNLSQELLGRKRDLEKVLTEAEGAESRFNKSKISSEELLAEANAAHAKLEQLINRQAELIRIEELRSAEKIAIERQVRAQQTYTTPKHTTNVRQEYSLEAETARYENNNHLEFDYNLIPEPPSFSRQSKSPATLREQIEVDYSLQAAPVVKRQPEVKPEQSFVEDRKPSQTSIQHEQSNTKQIRQDPRLGVLGALGKESNIYQG